MKNEKRNLQPKQKETNALWKMEMTKTKQNTTKMILKNHLQDNPDSVLR